MMPNPRRHSSHTNNNQSTDNPFQTQTTSTLFSHQNSVIKFFKKPLAFPFLLSALLFLTWVSLRLQRSSSSSSSSSSQYRQFSKEDDLKANLVRFVSGSDSFDLIMKDNRGWLLDPVKLALQSGLKGGAVSCASAHIGEIRPGSLRGNHRHHTSNETFVLWGAKTRFRCLGRHFIGMSNADIYPKYLQALENSDMDEGYAEVIIGADDVIVAVSPSGTAHALINVDPVRSTFLLGCQDGSSSASDFKVWKDL